MIPVFIGYDPREAVAYHVCVQSILDQTKEEVSFHPVSGEMRDGSNAFIYARFLVPWRMGFRGHAIFMDGDMIVRGDIGELWDLRSSHVGAQVVKHDYKTKHPVKYLGNPNNDYPRKNWSSVVLWSCGFFPNRMLTPKFVSEAPGSYLHRFQWLKDDQIGEIPEAWNKLVLEQTLEADDKLRHFTIGTPCFSEYADCDGAEDWHSTLGRALAPIRR
ncbi:MAG TPA: glycosyltransferase [Casimicrobiaceae bacterium]